MENMLPVASANLREKRSQTQLNTSASDSLVTYSAIVIWLIDLLIDWLI